jgi:hypothetical protein
MYLQSIKSVKHNAAKSVNRSILKKRRHLWIGVFVVHSSMYVSLDNLLGSYYEISAVVGVGGGGGDAFEVWPQAAVK